MSEGITKTYPTDLTQQEFDKAVRGVLEQFKDRLTAESMLAVVAHLCGRLIALQDQRKYTPDMVMKLVGKNIELGNAKALEEILNTKGSA